MEAICRVTLSVEGGAILRRESVVVQSFSRLKAYRKTFDHGSYIWNGLAILSAICRYKLPLAYPKHHEERKVACQYYIRDCGMSMNVVRFQSSKFEK